MMLKEEIMFKINEKTKTYIQMAVIFSPVLMIYFIQKHDWKQLNEYESCMNRCYVYDYNTSNECFKDCDSEFGGDNE